MPTLAEKVKRYKKWFRLDEFMVKMIHSRKKSDILGEAKTAPLYKQISITIYPNEIRSEGKEWPRNSVAAIERHEFGEAVIDIYFASLPVHIQDRKDFCAARDRLAEHIGKIVERFIEK